MDDFEIYFHEIDQATGKEAAIWIPHFPFPSPVLSMKIYPFEPQLDPQEFFTL